jgi:hypothetical protein
MLTNQIYKTDSNLTKHAIYTAEVINAINIKKWENYVILSSQRHSYYATLDPWISWNQLKHTHVHTPTQTHSRWNTCHSHHQNEHLLAWRNNPWYEFRWRWDVTVSWPLFTTAQVSTFITSIHLPLTTISQLKTSRFNSPWEG